MWQWLHTPGTTLDDGRPVTADLYTSLVPGQLDKIRAQVGNDAFAAGHFEEAARLLDRLVLSEQFVEFLTVPAYDELD